MKISLTIEAGNRDDLPHLRKLVEDFAALQHSDVDPSLGGINPADAFGDPVTQQAAPPVTQQAAPPVTQQAAPPVTAELDSRGVPWSADHHSMKKTTLNNGQWRAAQGTDKDALAAYENQFINAGPATGATMPGPTTGIPGGMPGQAAAAPQLTPAEALAARLSDVVITNVASLPWSPEYGKTYDQMDVPIAVNTLLVDYGILEGFAGITLEQYADKIEAITLGVNMSWPQA